MMDDVLHLVQDTCLIIQGISIIVFFTYFDITKKWLMPLLAVILALGIVILFIGMIWLLRLFWRFSDNYKKDYLQEHPEDARFLEDQDDDFSKK